MINRAAQRLPAEGRVHAIEISVEIGGENDSVSPLGAVPARVGRADVHVGGLVEVLIRVDVANVAYVLASHGVEHACGIPAEDLPGSLQKEPLRCGQDAREGETGVVDAVFATH